MWSSAPWSAPGAGKCGAQPRTFHPLGAPPTGLALWYSATFDPLGESRSPAPPPPHMASSGSTVPPCTGGSLLETQPKYLQPELPTGNTTPPLPPAPLTSPNSCVGEGGGCGFIFPPPVCERSSLWPLPRCLSVLWPVCAACCADSVAPTPPHLPVHTSPHGGGGGGGGCRVVSSTV